MPTVLMNKKQPSLKRNIYQNQSKQLKNGKSHGGVRLDKNGLASGRAASDQPASDSGVSDKSVSGTKSYRSKSDSKSSRAKVPFTIHIDPILKAEVKRLAELNTGNENDSASAEGAALLEAMVRQKIHLQQAATLDTTLERLMAKFYRRMAGKLAFFLTIIVFNTGNTNVLVNNLLGMQKGMSEELLKDILRDADRQTKRSLSRKYPDLAPIIDAVEHWLLAEEDGESAPAGDLSADRQGTNGKNGKGGKGI
jgi:predicted kinase